MSIQIKVQVLAITDIEKRTYNGRSWHQRQFQCFAEGKVAVHTLNAADGDAPEALKARNDLIAYQHGSYMAEVNMQQGDRGRMEFTVTSLTPITSSKLST